MASSNNERGNSQTEASTFTNISLDNKHTDPPPPTATYPAQPPLHPMYYPNPHAYPQYPNGYPVGYHYPQPAPYYGPPPTYHTSGACSRFFQSFILCSCMILTCLFFASLILALVLRPRLPVYKVVAMSVTNFTAPTLAGQWDTKITIENPNDKLMAYFSDFKVYMLYKDGVVAINRAPGFMLNTNDKMDVNVTGFSDKANEDMLEKTTMDDLVKERSLGSVTFTLRVSSINMFRSGSFSTGSEELMAVCKGLKVVFQNNNNSSSNNSIGTLDNKGKPIECQIYI